jgi:hypothetical protein
MEARSSLAIDVARSHIKAWSSHDWVTTRALLSPDIHAWVTSTQPGSGTSEITGIDAHMAPKVRAAQLIEPGSVREIVALGDEQNALVVVTFEIGLGQDGSLMTMVRSCVYRLDESSRIQEERDSFYLVPSATAIGSH